MNKQKGHGLRAFAPALVVMAAALGALPGAHAAGPDAPAQVEAAARRFLSDQATLKGLVEPQFELHLATPGATPPAPCAQPLTVEPADTRYLSRMRFSVACPASANAANVANAAGWRRDWIVRAEVSALVVVAAADVPANRPLAEAELAMERRKLTELADALPAPDAAVGQASTRPLRSGQPVLARFLAQPMLVRRGESVTIVARNAGIEVQVAGEAVEPGRRGEVIKVRNASTGKVIRARVVDSGVVEPEGIAGSSADQSRD